MQLIFIFVIDVNDLLCLNGPILSSSLLMLCLNLCIHDPVFALIIEFSRFFIVKALLNFHFSPQNGYFEPIIIQFYLLNH